MPKIKSKNARRVLLIIFLFSFYGCGDKTTDPAAPSPSSTTTPTPSPSPSAVTAFRLPDTGQTEFYTDTSGEDNDYTINPPSYTDNGNGAITDNVTELMWQKEDDNTERTWADAGTYCDTLTLAGYSDWRLPARKELVSIVNYGKYSYAIDTTYFPNTTSSFWSSTTYVRSSSDAWSVYFGNGDVDYYNKTVSNYARCVRPGQ